jgi:poly(A) polymerase
MIDDHDNMLPRLNRAFQAAGHRLYLVGGAVRDSLRGWHGGDADLATAATPAEVKSILARARLGTVYAVGEKFGTIGLASGDRIYEITTFRAAPESPPPAAGDVPPDLYGDLAHRDFTINAMARDLHSDALYDPFGGQADLQAGIIRGVGEAAARFSEDPLRLLRAVRLATQLGCTIEPNTQAAMRALAPRLEPVARERVAQELNKMLVSEQPSRGLRLLDATGLLEYTLPEILPMHGMEQGPVHYKDVYEHTLLVVDRTAPDLILRWAALLHDIAKPRTYSVQNGEVHFFGHEVIGSHMARDILTRLRQPLEMIDHVRQLVEQHLRIGLYDASWTDGAVRRFIRETAPVTERLFALARADVTSANPRKVREAMARTDTLLARCEALLAQEEVEKIKSPLDGNELMAMFARPPGPWIRDVKEYLLNLVLDGALGQEDKEQATELARAFVAAHDTPTPGE